MPESRGAPTILGLGTVMNDTGLAGAIGLALAHDACDRIQHHDIAAPVPPVVIATHVAQIPYRVVLRYSLPVAGVSLCVLLPIDYLWWRVIGYFG